MVTELTNERDVLTSRWPGATLLQARIDADLLSGDLKKARAATNPCGSSTSRSCVAALAFWERDWGWELLPGGGSGILPV